LGKPSEDISVENKELTHDQKMERSLWFCGRIRILSQVSASHCITSTAEIRLGYGDYTQSITLGRLVLAPPVAL
jgi:hypothetical protein